MAEDTHSQAAGRVVFCPQCGHPLPFDARLCPNCGVDLALLSLLGEKAYLEGFPKYAPMNTTPVWLVPRIGEFLIEDGVITREQLSAALRHQKQAEASGQRILLGQSLVALGFIDRETLDQALTRQIVARRRAGIQPHAAAEGQSAHTRASACLGASGGNQPTQGQPDLEHLARAAHSPRTFERLCGIAGGGRTRPPLTRASRSDAIEVVRRATDRLSSLIGDLIEFSTASREGLTLHRRAVDVAELVAGVFKRSQAKAEKAGVRLKAELEEGLPQLHADPERLSWAIYQLVDNGIKFTPDGGEVVVQVRRDGAGLHFTVQDSGIGIPQDRLEEIFEPFHQLDSSPTRRYGGTGLGLALVRIILEAHGTSLQVESEEGHGTRFDFVLPDVSGT